MKISINVRVYLKDTYLDLFLGGARDVVLLVEDHNAANRHKPHHVLHTKGAWTVTEDMKSTRNNVYRIRRNKRRGHL